MVKLLIFSSIFFFFSFSQDTFSIKEDRDNFNESEIENQTVIVDEARVDIVGFGDFELSDSYMKLKNLFGEAPYGFLVLNDTNKIEESKNKIRAYKNDFFDSFNLQFDKERKLYLIEIKITKKNENFNRLYNILKNKYGMPQKVSFKQIIWSKKSRKLIFRRDGIVRYLDVELLKGRNEGIPISELTKSDKKKLDAIKARGSLETYNTYSDIENLY